MSQLFVVPDVHGNFDSLEMLLEDAGIVRDGKRVNRELRVVCLGDLANCVRDRNGYDSEEDDLACLSTVGDWIDKLLVGNHEHPHFGGPSFHGFHPSEAVGNRLRELNEQNLLGAAVHHEDILLTHAGLSQHWGRMLNSPKTAAAASERLREFWHRDPNETFFSAIGCARGGWEREGGVLWSDYDEPKYSQFRQLIGHTPGPVVRTFGPGPSYCIDLGGGKMKQPWGSRLAGAFLDNGNIDILEVELGDESTN
jgi:hypothetical protein